MNAYAERRVLSLLLANPDLTVDLKPEDFEYSWHREIYAKRAPEVALMAVPDDVKAFALGLEENWTPENLVAFVGIVKRNAAARRFAASVSRLRK